MGWDGINMDCYLEGMRDFWERRFMREERVWGSRPSKTADYAMQLFEGVNIKDILIPGAGYGRNTKLFSDCGYHVTGIEISQKAVSIATQFDPGTRFITGSVLDVAFEKQSFDAVYCFNVLHLFRQKERQQFVSKCCNWLKTPGYMFFTAFSMDEPSFGKGREMEKNTFESKIGRPTHYFSDEDLREHFKNLDILETGVMEDPESHGELGEHIHKVAYIFAKKSSR